MAMMVSAAGSSSAGKAAAPAGLPASRPLRKPTEAKTRNVMRTETIRAFSEPKRSVRGTLMLSRIVPTHSAV